MKVEVDNFTEMLLVDVQTERYGGAASQVAEDNVTRVIYGGLYAAVELLDLRVRVTMTPTQGSWRDIAWARKQAFEVLGRPEILTAVIQGIAQVNRASGYNEGARAARRAVRRALGCDEELLCEGPES